MYRRVPLQPLSAPALVMALIVGIGLPVLQPVAKPQPAVAAAAGVALLRPVTTVHSNGAELSWDRYVPVIGETFTRYEVHRSATAAFTPSASTLLTTIRDNDVTSWTDTTARPATSFSYKVVANSAVSNELRVAMPAAGTATKTLQPDGAAGRVTEIVHDISTPAACSDDRNYGATSTMGIGPDASGWQRRGLIKFDLRDIPAAATVSSATLTMSYAATSNPALAVSLHRLRQPWDEGTGAATCNESGATWLAPQRGVKWKTGGSSYDATADASLAAKSRSVAGADVFTLTSLVREWVTGARPNHGVLVKGTTDTPDGLTNPWFNYYTDDHATVSVRPKLVVSYTDGSAAVGPRVAMSTPEAGARVRAAVPLTATAGDDRRVDKVEFLVDGLVVATDTAAPWAASWSSTSVIAGAHSLTARATDDAGNVKTSAARSVTVDNSAAPAVALSAPASGASVKGTVTVSATASDDVGVSSVEFYVDDQRIGSDSTAPFSAAWNTLDVVDPAYDGPHVLLAKAYDAGGQVTTSTARTVTTTNTVGTSYNASMVLDEPGNSTTPLALPETFLDNNLAPASDPYDGSTGTSSLDSAPKNSTSGYATYGGTTTFSSQSKTTSLGSAPATSTELIPPATRDPESISKDALWADITVTNESGVAWKGGTSGLQLWYRWYVPTEVPKGDGSPGDTGVVLFEGPASQYFPQTMQAGQTKVVPIVVEPPRLPDGIDKAQVRLRFDLYDVDATTGSKWFASRGNKPLDNPVVVNRDLEGALGLERFWQYDGEETGAGSATLTNVANGNMLWRWSPFFAPGRGLATMVDLTYNSLEDHSESPAGNNFSLSISGLTRWGYGLDIHPNKADEVSGRSNKYVTLTDGDGTTHEFTGTTQSDGTTNWTEPPGVNLYLRSLGGTDPARQWALTRPDRTTFYFDSDGYARSVEDRNGNTLTFTLVDTPPGEDPGGPKKRITKVTDAAGRSFTVDYYSKSEVKKAHVRGNIKTIKDHSGSELYFEYYDDGNLLRLTQRGGTSANGATLADRSFVYTYTTSNGAGPAIPALADRANPAPKTPNQSTRLYSIRDPRGHETAFAYYGPGSAQLRWKLKSRWNRLGDPAAACTSANSCTAFSYNITSRRTTVDAPESRDTDYVYDTTGKVVTIVNPLEQTTSLLWSPDFKVERVTEPGGAIQTWKYNHNGYLTEQVDGVGNKTTLTYLNRSLDGDDTLGHWSLLRTKTSARGNQTTDATDFTWTFDYASPAGDDGNVTKVTDPENFVSTYDWNLRGSTSAGTVRRTVDPNNGVTTFDYDPSGLPKLVTDAAGQTTQMGYDVDGLLRWVQDPNHSAEADPTGDGDAADRVAAAYLDYDSFHRLGRQSAPKSSDVDRGKLIWSSAAMDANDNVQRGVDAHYGTADGDAENGPATSTTFDSMDQPTEQANQESEKLGYRWDKAGRMVQVTKPKGTASTGVADDFSSIYAYDVLDRATTQSDFGTSSAQVRRTHMCYDVPGDLRSVTSPRAGLPSPSCPGNGPSTADFTTTYTYDAAHRQVSRRDPLGHESRTTYDANNNVTVQEKDIDKAGAPGRITRTKRTYDERDLPVKSEELLTGTRTLTTVVRYDGNGNRSLMAPPRAVDQANGATIDANSPFVTSYRYDAVNRLNRITHPFGPAETERHYTHRAFDKNGNLLWTSFPVTTSDPANVQPTAKTTMEYWDPGWIRTSKKPTDPELSFDYAAQSWQTSRTPDKKGQPGVPDTERKMIWTYYDDAQLKERRDRDGNPSTYKFDANNNLTEAVDASGVTGADDNPMETLATWTGFDEIAKTSHRKKTDAASPNPWKFTTYAYDDNGNVTRRLENGEENAAQTAVTKGADEHLLFYDKADWLTRQLNLDETNLDLTTKADCKDDQRVLNSFFDTGWEKKREIYRAGAGCTATDDTWPLKQTTTWQHFDNGKLKLLQTTNGSGAVTTKHDVEYLESTTLAGGVSGQRYENGNRTIDRYVLKRADTQTTCTDAANPCVADFDYDAREKLVRHQRRAGVVDTYKLDEPANLMVDTTIRAGNVTTEDKAEDPPVTKKYESNELKELTVGASSASYVYDPYGNVDCVTMGAGASSCPTANLIQDYAYDALDRLASQKTYGAGGSSVTDSADYTYDALDRVTKEVETHSNPGDSRTTNFTHQGLSNLVTEEKQSGGTNPKTKTFSYDAYGHRISMSDTVNGTTTTDTFTYAYDVHGSVSQLITDSGQVKSSYGYDAYGGEDEGLTTTQDATTDTDTKPLNPYRFQGRRLDSGSATATSEARSVDMGARRYGVDTGRFLQQDMLAGALADLGLTLDPLSQNSYALAGGNPVSYVEVDGHMLMADGGGGASTSPNPTSTTDSDSSSGGTSGSTSTSGSNPWETGSDISDFVIGPLMAGPEEIGEWGSWAGKRMHSRYSLLRSLGGKFNAGLRHNPTMTSIGRWARGPVGTWAGRGLAVAGGVLSFAKHYSEGDRELAAGAKAGIEFGGALAGAKAGAVAGAALGSVVPGVGTAAGAFVGGIIGAGVGAFAAGELMDSSFGQGVEDVADTVQDWGGDVIEGAGDALEDAGDFLGF
jgi:RHS repeat-associated protein